MPLPSSKKNVGLGHAIINRVSRDAKSRPRSEFHTTDVSSSSKHGLASVTQQGDLEEFLNTAQLAEQDFTAERRNVTVVQAPSNARGAASRRGENPFLLGGHDEAVTLQRQRENKQRLRVPRRPAWDAKTTPAELNRREKDSFLEWRRNLAQLTDAQHFILTPFERNIEVWRQLWRVLERSHLVVQIVDARNPLKFRCEDLERYVEQLGVVSKEGLSYVGGEGSSGMGPRRNLLLINKADLLDEGQRKTWAKWFDERGIRYAFFSAANAAAVQAAAAAAEAEQEAKEAEDEEQGDENGAEEAESEDDEDVAESGDEDTKLSEAVQAAHLAKPLVGSEPATVARETASAGHQSTLSEAVDEATTTHSAAAPSHSQADPTRVLNVLELEELFMASAPPLSEFHSSATNGTPSHLTVGLVGYPNVGKSSTINALLGSKKVSVSSTPGKTKHFQTLPFSDRVTLCDCPGLVFPQFATSTGELIVDGVLPIDQMREYTAPAELVARRVPKDVLEGFYGVRIQTLEVEEGGTGRPTGLEVLTSYAVARGFVRQGQGNPDESRAARYVLKDYVNARLLYCNPPPGVDEDEFNAAQRQRAREALKGRRYDPLKAEDEDASGTANAAPVARIGAKSRALDAAFFSTGQDGGARAKGRKGQPGSGVVSGRVGADGKPMSRAEAASAQGMAAGASGGKKHFKKKQGKVRYAGVTNEWTGAP